MADILSGSQTLSEARKLQTDLINLLERGGMQLHKWVSNHSQLYENDKLGKHITSN